MFHQIIEKMKILGCFEISLGANFFGWSWHYISYSWPVNRRTLAIHGLSTDCISLFNLELIKY